MTDITVQERISAVLAKTGTSEFHDVAVELLDVLGYQSERTTQLTGDVAEFIDAFPVKNKGTQSEKSFLDNADYVNILFQLTNSEIEAASASQHFLFDEGVSFDNGNQQSFLFVGVELKQSEYPRSRYAEFAREVNKRFTIPTVVIFKTPANLITLSFMNRRPNRMEHGRSVLGNVSLIRQIDASKPHTAHLRVVEDLRFFNLVGWMRDRAEPINFDGLLHAWLAKLDVQELNKQFYDELFTWFVRAVNEATFPANQPTTVKRETHIVRLITRLLFVWFIKEKGLVASNLFNQDKINLLLKSYDPRKRRFILSCHPPKFIFRDVKYSCE